MCTGKCSKVIAIPLYVLALVSVICNIMAFFPDFKTTFTEPTEDGTIRLTKEVPYMGGVIGGGIMVLIPAIHIHLTSTQGCCANRCGMFLSIGFAAVGVAGALYSLAVAGLGMANGPTCLFLNPKGIQMWGEPFANSSGSYLGDRDLWSTCILPKNVVEFNVGLFSTLLVAASLELVLCSIQMVNGLFGCLCGTCGSKE